MGSAALVLALFAGLVPAPAAPDSCRPTPLALWGDGRHDDTAALNAWFRGDKVVWADSGRPVGPEIAGHTFKL
ncbi:MAG TPA: hypothetical protein VE993_10370, partial [Stellaceae bacterium]|nr:hypothetical protein [Stellaceae bacterium]